MDIDAYACCVAYSELLNIINIPAVAFSSSILNESVTATVRSWGHNFTNDYTINSNDSFIIVDTSDQLDKAVDIRRVEEVVDHHSGYEDFWNQKIANKVQIEQVGAAATLIFERWQTAGLLNEMSELSAKLLLTGILDNTLDFKSNVTTDRDISAYNSLKKIANLSENYPAEYFRECQGAILMDVAHAITNDSKILSFKNLDLEKIAFGQLVIWDGKIIIEKYLNEIKNAMSIQSTEWFVNLVSIDEGKSYFISDSEQVREWIEKITDVNFIESIAEADRLWLRKEIVRQDLDFEPK